MIPNYNSIRMLSKKETDDILATIDPEDVNDIGPTLLGVWAIGITLIIAGIVACIVL